MAIDSIDSYILAIDSIQSVQNIVNGPSETPLQLNDGQCKILAQELLELSFYLRDISVKFKDVGQDVWQIVLLQLYSVIKRAELLVEKCCCKNSESWLVEAMTLVEIQENFAAIVLDLHYWRMVMSFAIAPVMGASRDREKELLTMEEEYQEAYKKLHSSNHVLQESALEDKKKIKVKLAEVQSENSVEYLRALHLLSWLDEPEKTPLAAFRDDGLQMMVEHEYWDKDGKKRDPLIGTGGYSVVRRVKWLGVHCALKVLDVIDEREATVLKGLLHPNVVRLYLYWEDLFEIEPGLNAADGFEIEPAKPKSNLLMELMDTDLRRYIKSRLNYMREYMSSGSAEQSGEGEDMMPFSLPVAIDIMLQVAQALLYLHERHLTHRDLKTANILVRRVSKILTSFHREGYVEVKLADFGLAKAYDNTTTSERLTPNIGTPVYGAPEIFGKDLAAQRNFPPMADVWGFGVVCSEILSGKEPFVNERRATLQARIAPKENLRPPLPKHCPEYLAFIIRSCWEFRPEGRPDFASICRMLRHAKLVSLGIMDLEDCRSFMAYTTRRGIVKSLRDRRARKVGITSRFASLFRYFIPSIPEVRKIPNEKPVEVQTEEYYSATGEKMDRSKLVFFDDKKYSFDLDDLLRASAEVLGKGSVGTAYKANLEDQTILVIKRLTWEGDLVKDKRDFESQLQVVGKLQHRNVLPLRAYYFSKSEQLLVYDFMIRGSLSALLHGNQGSNRLHLDWASRVKIATGAAKGLAYLHAQGGPKLVHSNIKSSNILLDTDLNACISDFGLVQLLTSSSAQAKIIGYRAPEVTGPQNATHKSDVYSFGVLLLELLTGKAPTQARANGDAIDLPKWVQSIVRKEWTAEVFDAELLRYNSVEGEMVNLLQIAMRCVENAPERRPTMSEVQLLLEDVRQMSMDNSQEITSR